MRRTALALVAAAAALSARPGPAADASIPYHAVRYLMGTWCDLTVFDAPPQTAAPAAAAAFQEIARVEDVMSTWRPDSELSRVNRGAGSPQTVSLELAEVVRAALDICRRTGGAFDPSVGPLLHVWRFDTETPSMPAARAASEARARVGCGRVALDADARVLRLPDGASLDLGGIGKGYAVDRALDVMRAHGVTRAKVDFGSSSLAFAGHREGGWPVVVVDPRDRDVPLLSFEVEAGAVSSSGQRERSLVRKGRRYGHIFDPRTGAPVESDLLLVTVIAPNGIVADALSTALFVMGPEEGAEMLSRSPGLGAIFVSRTNGTGVALRVAGAVRGLRRLAS